MQKVKKFTNRRWKNRILQNRLMQEGIQDKDDLMRERFVALLQKEDLKIYQDGWKLNIYSESFDPFRDCGLEIKKSTKGNRFVFMPKEILERLLSEYPKIEREEVILFGKTMK